jgi:hypothetical protein
VSRCLKALSWILVREAWAPPSCAISCGCGFDYCDGHLRQMSLWPTAVQQVRP